MTSRVAVIGGASLNPLLLNPPHGQRSLTFFKRLMITCGG